MKSIQHLYTVSTPSDGKVHYVGGVHDCTTRMEQHQQGGVAAVVEMAVHLCPQEETVTFMRMAA